MLHASGRNTEMGYAQLFPTSASLAIFVGYIALFIGQGLLVKASQGAQQRYAYNTSVAVLLTEVVKLLLSVGLYLRTNTLRSLIGQMTAHTCLVKFYMVPSFLYCVYNNLQFVNLLHFDPTTYYLLLQFRVVITGLIFQIVFRKILTRMQWLSLSLLTAGCIVNRLDLGAMRDGTFGSSVRLNVFVLLIGLQAVCSCLAGVYNEYILKNQGADVNIYVQNVYMYIDSILANVLFLAVLGSPIEVSGATPETVDERGAGLWSPVVLLVIVNNACIGIVTSFFLKYLNSILKTFASALELMFTAVLCYLLFGIAITLNTVLSIGIVSLAIFLYARAPVGNGKPSSSSLKLSKQQREDEANRVMRAEAGRMTSDEDVEAGARKGAEERATIAV